MPDDKGLVVAGSIIGAIAGGVPGAIIGGLIGAGLQQYVDSLCPNCKNQMERSKQLYGEYCYCKNCGYRMFKEKR
jgi:uncharacterized protein YcfJ